MLGTISSMEGAITQPCAQTEEAKEIRVDEQLHEKE